MHKPSLIAYSPYNHHIYTKIMIDPMYMQVSPAVVPLQMQQPTNSSYATLLIWTFIL